MSEESAEVTAPVKFLNNVRWTKNENAAVLLNLYLSDLLGTGDPF